MATVTAPQPGVGPSGSTRPDRASILPERLQRVPAWLWITGGLIALMALSAFLRSRYLSGQF